MYENALEETETYVKYELVPVFVQRSPVSRLAPNGTWNSNSCRLRGLHSGGLHKVRCKHVRYQLLRGNQHRQTDTCAGVVALTTKMLAAASALRRSHCVMRRSHTSPVTGS